MTEEDVIRRRLLIDGDGTGDDRRLNVLLKTLIKWCNTADESPEDRVVTCELKMTDQRLNTKWLDDKLVNNIVQSDKDLKGKFERVKNIKCEPATNPGDNYSSEMHRLTIECSDESGVNQITKSYVVKCMFSVDTTIGKNMKDNGIFDKEMNMYKETLMKIEEVISSIGDNLSFSPKLILFTEAPYELLVMEDLRSSGFKMAERRKGLDEKHSKLVFAKLAKFHAASMYLNRQNPQFRRRFNRGAFYDDMPETLITYFTNGIIQGAETIKRIASCQRFVKYFENYASEMVTDGKRLLTPVPEDCFDYNVLTHGDLWLNNMLFKYNEDGEPIDVKFVDFQMSTFSGPGLDINYLFFSSIAEDTRAKHRDSLLADYITILRSTLTKLNHDALIPTRDDLDKQLLKSKGIAIMTICIALPIFKLDKETSSTITTEAIMDNPEAETRINMYANKLYKDSLEVALHHLEDIGFITGSD